MASEGIKMSRDLSVFIIDNEKRAGNYLDFGLKIAKGLLNRDATMTKSAAMSPLKATGAAIRVLWALRPSKARRTACGRDGRLVGRYAAHCPGENTAAGRPRRRSQRTGMIAGAATMSPALHRFVSAPTAGSIWTAARAWLSSIRGSGVGAFTGTHIDVSAVILGLNMKPQLGPDGMPLMQATDTSSDRPRRCGGWCSGIRQQVGWPRFVAVRPFGPGGIGDQLATGGHKVLDDLANFEAGFAMDPFVGTAKVIGGPSMLMATANFKATVAGPDRRSPGPTSL
ncbi:hypothetical protein BH11PLA2_BH11PLA2_50380 [soil metagenome]